MDEMARKLVEQAQSYIANGLPRNLLSREDFAEATGYLLRFDPSLEDVLFAVEELHEQLWTRSEMTKVRKACHKISLRIEHLLHMREEHDKFEPFFIRFARGYVIYHLEPLWIGIRADHLDLREQLFAQFQAQSLPPFVLVENSEAALEAAIARSPAVTEPVGQYGARVPRERMELIHPTATDYALLQILEERTRRLEAVYNSTSWVVTWPLRQAMTLARRGAGLLRRGVAS
ncbi:MAG: hypothetical protein JOZ58_07075 [Acetobacteraceae bacterium]|nr:hypothetical protein [Acetobacteraceae bacterium]